MITKGSSREENQSPSWNRGSQTKERGLRGPDFESLVRGRNVGENGSLHVCEPQVLL